MAGDGGDDGRRLREGESGRRGPGEPPRSEGAAARLVRLLSASPADGQFYRAMPTVVTGIEADGALAIFADEPDADELLVAARDVPPNLLALASFVANRWVSSTYAPAAVSCVPCAIPPELDLTLYYRKVTYGNVSFGGPPPLVCGDDEYTTPLTWSPGTPPITYIPVGTITPVPLYKSGFYFSGCVTIQGYAVGPGDTCHEYDEITSRFLLACGVVSNRVEIISLPFGMAYYSDGLSECLAWDPEGTDPPPEGVGNGYGGTAGWFWQTAVCDPEVFEMRDTVSASWGLVTDYWVYRTPPP